MVYSVRRTVFSVRRTLYEVEYIVYIVQCLVYIMCNTVIYFYFTTLLLGISQEKTLVYLPI